MSKKNIELAEKIVDRLVTIDKHRIEIKGSSKIGANDGEYKDVYTARILVLGYATTVTGDTKKEARIGAIEYLSSELDAGNLSLSDTWAEDNLGA